MTELGVSLLPLLVALALVSWQLTRPHQLLGAIAYDDGVYFAAADRLVHGLLPYRDFVFVHPPGIALLMAPVAELGRVIGTDNALAVARILTAAAAVGNVAVVSRLLGNQGRVARFVGAMALACFPLAVAADNTLALEPFVVLFCLLGLLWWHRSRGRVRHDLVAGALIGIGCAVKIDAAIVLAVVIGISLWRSPRRGAVVALGAGSAIGLLCLPFFLFAPGAFVHDVIVSQLARASNGSSDLGLVTRLRALTGTAGVSALPIGGDLTIGLFISAAASVVTLYVLRRRQIEDLAWFALLSSAATITTMLFTPAFYGYYAYLPAALSALVVANVFEHVVALICSRVSMRLVALLRFGLVALSMFAVEQAFVFSTRFVSADRQSAAREVISATVPKGACVVFDEPALAIVAGRLDSSDPNCPALVDPFGIWLSAAPSDPPPTPTDPPQLVARWRHWLGRSAYLVEVAPESDFIPWSPQLTTWFDSHYRLIAAGANVYVYANSRS